MSYEMADMYIPKHFAESDEGILIELIRGAPLGTLSESLGAGAACLVISGGAQGYVSPSWYATKKEHGRVVPTWNYAVAHVHGSAVVIDEPGWVLDQLNELTDQNESLRADPWAVSDAPADFVHNLVARLVGVEITIERIEGKTKASQNQPERNQASVLEALAKEQPDSAMTRSMRSILVGET